MTAYEIMSRKAHMEAFRRNHDIPRFGSSFYTLWPHWGAASIYALKEIQKVLKQTQTGVWDAKLQGCLYPPAAPSAIQRLIAVELHEVGVKENPPGSNAGPRVSQYEAVCGLNHEPWCGCFQRWALKEIGYKGPLPPNPAYVPSWVAWARQHGLTVKTSRPGDLVTFDWARDGVGNHIGLVHGWPNTIEGNTSVGNNSNGGEVMVRDRGSVAADVLCFIRLPL